jgi:hypothetical protein
MSTTTPAWSWTHWFRGLFVPRAREQTAEEYRLAQLLAAANATLDQLRQDVRTLKVELEISGNRVIVLERVAKDHIAVIERNQMRIDAESAEYARRIAMATTFAKELGRNGAAP